MRRLLLGLAVVTMGTWLLTASGGGGAVTLAPLPTDWGITRYGSNPIITVGGNPNESVEQYVPAPILLPSGDIWIYVKGTSRIYAWKSTDGGTTFSLQNSNNPVLAPVSSTWESSFVLEPTTLYDPATDTIHLYYKGRTSSTTSWAWGHATAPGTDPVTFTRDSNNPILTSAEAASQLGGSIGGDLAISDVIKVGNVWHFYGYALHSSDYKLLHATGTTWNNPSGLEILLTAASKIVTTVASPCVFALPGGAPLWVMLYSIGNYSGANSARIRVGTSYDLVTWDFSDNTDFMAPVAATWESYWTYACSILRDGLSVYPYENGDGDWMLYFSGYNGSSANVGLATLNPS